MPASVAGTREGYVKGPEDQKLRQLERVIDLGEDGLGQALGREELARRGLRHRFAEAAGLGSTGRSEAKHHAIRYPATEPSILVPAVAEARDGPMCRHTPSVL